MTQKYEDNKDTHHDSHCTFAAACEKSAAQLLHRHNHRKLQSRLQSLYDGNWGPVYPAEIYVLQSRKNGNVASNFLGRHSGNHTRLHILVEDATCTYMCNDCCKYHHWQLDIPLDDTTFPFKSGFPENASLSDALKPYILPNSSDKIEYMNFCPPKDQTHAIVIQLTAYHMESGEKLSMDAHKAVPILFPSPHPNRIIENTSGSGTRPGWGGMEYQRYPM